MLSILESVLSVLVCILHAGWKITAVHLFCDRYVLVSFRSLATVWLQFRKILNYCFSPTDSTKKYGCEYTLYLQPMCISVGPLSSSFAVQEKGLTACITCALFIQFKASQGREFQSTQFNANQITNRADQIKDIIQKNGNPSMLWTLGALLGLVCMGSWLLSLLSP